MADATSVATAPGTIMKPIDTPSDARLTAR